jgi:acyl carrier protein
MMSDGPKVPVVRDEELAAIWFSGHGEPAPAPEPEPAPVASVEELLKALPDHLDYSFQPDTGSDELVITFSSSRIRFAPNEDKFRRNVLQLREKNVNYYVLEADLVAHVLRTVASHFSKVIFTGTSRAGYGALLLAGLCAQQDSGRAYSCLAFSAPTHLYRADEEVRDSDLQSRMDDDEVLQDSVERFGDLAFVQGLANLHILLVYSEKFPKDVVEAARLCAPNVRKYPVPFSLHGSDKLFTLRGIARPEVERRMRQFYRAQPKAPSAAWPEEWERAVDEIVLNRWVPSVATLMDEMVSVPLLGDERAIRYQPRKRTGVADAARGEAVAPAAEVIAAAFEGAPGAAGVSGVDRDISEIVRHNFPDHRKPITDATRFQDLAGWDSVGHVAMMLDVESRFGVTIQPEEMFEIVDVARLKQRILAA